MFLNLYTLFFLFIKTLHKCTLGYLLLLIVLPITGVTCQCVPFSKWVWLFLFLSVYFIRIIIMTPVIWLCMRVLSFGGSYYFFFKIITFIYYFINKSDKLLLTNSFPLVDRYMFSLSISSESFSFFFFFSLFYFFFILFIWLYKLYTHFFYNNFRINYLVGFLLLPLLQFSDKYHFLGFIIFVFLICFFYFSWQNL